MANISVGERPRREIPTYRSQHHTSTTPTSVTTCHHCHPLLITTTNILHGHRHDRSPCAVGCRCSSVETAKKQVEMFQSKRFSPSHLAAITRHASSGSSGYMPAPITRRAPNLPCIPLLHISEQSSMLRCHPVNTPTCGLSAPEEGLPASCPNTAGCPFDRRAGGEEEAEKGKKPTNPVPSHPKGW